MRRERQLRSSGLSPTHDEALAPDVGGSEQRTMRRIHARQGCSRVHHERPDDADLVAEPSERFHDARSDAILELESAKVIGPRRAPSSMTYSRPAVRSVTGIWREWRYGC